VASGSSPRFRGATGSDRFVAGLRKDSITAPFVVDASMNGEIFLTYLEQFLVPTLLNSILQ
jgi:hypothetical protein